MHTKRNISYFIILFLTGMVFISANDPKSPSGQDLAKIMFKKTKDIEAMIFKMNKQERIRGEMVEQESFVKLARNPYKVYSRQLHPEEGLEVLYVEGQRDNNALINPNGFPWMNLKLDPNGKIMRKDQHHTIRDSGYDLVMAILEHLFEKYGDEISSMVENKGMIEWRGNSCWVVEMSNPYFQYNKYTVKPGETIISIAEENMLSEHMIVEHNAGVDDFYDVTAGQVIEIPNDYSPKIILYIDKDMMIPRLMKIYDDKGLYEQYEYKDLVVNPAISPEEFTEEYEEYGF
ncbi:MAG: DUF1571 domain-containing protein [Candidatus Cyclobacteriaceae bacterium M2_1C_046]